MSKELGDIGNFFAGFIVGAVAIMIIALFVFSQLALGMDNVTVSVDKGTTTSCDEVGDTGGDTYVECRRIDALIDKERKALNKAIENAYTSPDKGDDLIADQLCEFRPYKDCEHNKK